MKVVILMFFALLSFIFGLKMMVDSKSAFDHATTGGAVSLAQSEFCRDAVVSCGKRERRGRILSVRDRNGEAFVELFGTVGRTVVKRKLHNLRVIPAAEPYAS